MNFVYDLSKAGNFLVLAKEEEIKKAMDNFS